MNVTLEQIDELRSRVNVSYEEAKRVLENNNGDLIKSIIELENKKGIKNNPKKGGFSSAVDKLLELKLRIKNKNGDIILNLPLVVVLITFMMAFWVVAFGFLLALITSCDIKIYRDKNSIKVNGLKKNMQETVDKIKVKSEKIINEDEELESNVSEVVEVKTNSDDDNSTNEIIIE
ncbi:MAG: ubiquitin-associated protein [Bacillota bacterium]|nr:ubiquitin-associated protein [Bacillota bacterium]